MMRAWLAALIVEGIGAAVLTLLSSDLKRGTTALKLGMSFGLGWVVLTCSLFLGSVCGLKPGASIGVAEMVVLWGAAVVFRRAQLGAWLPRRPSAPRGLDVALLAFIVGVCLVVGAVSLLEPVVEWDVISIWALKAQVLRHETVTATGYFHDLARAYSHLDYPLLWPLAMAWIWAWVGHTDWEAVKVLAPSLLCASAATFYGLLRRRVDRTLALAFVALLVGLPAVLSQTSRLLSDAPLAYFAMGAFLCTYLWLEAGHPDDLRLAGFLAAGMLFTKNEGIGLLVILVATSSVCVFVQRRPERALPLMGWILVAPLVLTATWFVFRMGIPKAHEDYGARLHPSHFLHNFPRVPQILSGSLRYFGDWTDWLAFWPAWAIAVAVGVRGWVRRPPAFLLAAVVLVLLMYGTTYVVSPWEPEELMETTANRLMLHVVPLCVFLLAELVRPAGP